MATIGIPASDESKAEATEEGEAGAQVQAAEVIKTPEDMLIEAKMEAAFEPEANSISPRMKEMLVKSGSEPEQQQKLIQTSIRSVQLARFVFENCFDGAPGDSFTKKVIQDDVHELGGIAGWGAGPNVDNFNAEPIDIFQDPYSAVPMLSRLTEKMADPAHLEENVNAATLCVDLVVLLQAQNMIRVRGGEDATHIAQMMQQLRQDTGLEQQ